MNLTLFRRTLAAYRVRLLAVGTGMFAWGFVLPIIYATFGQDLKQLVEGNPLPVSYTHLTLPTNREV